MEGPAGIDRIGHGRLHRRTRVRSPVRRSTGYGTRPPSLVLILAWTNDIGALTATSYRGGGECDDGDDDDVAGAISAVVDPIIRQHRACHGSDGGGDGGDAVIGGRGGANSHGGRAGERVAGSERPRLDAARRRQ